MAVAAARKWWAARRRRSHLSPRARGNDGGSINGARFALFAPLLLAGAVMLCAAIGFAVTQVSEGRLEAAQHATLQRALDEFHAEFGDVDAPDDVQLRRIAHRAGLGDLRFDADPTGEGGRQVQSLHDARGASSAGSVGRPMVHWSARSTAVGLLAAIGAVLACAAFLPYARRSGWSTRSIRAPRPYAS